jgi:hypothetical protein
VPPPLRRARLGERARAAAERRWPLVVVVGGGGGASGGGGSGATRPEKPADAPLAARAQVAGADDLPSADCMA